MGRVSSSHKVKGLGWVGQGGVYLNTLINLLGLPYPFNLRLR